MEQQSLKSSYLSHLLRYLCYLKDSSKFPNPSARNYQAELEAILAPTKPNTSRNDDLYQRRPSLERNQNEPQNPPQDPLSERNSNPTNPNLNRGPPFERNVNYMNDKPPQEDFFERNPFRNDNPSLDPRFNRHGDYRSDIPPRNPRFMRNDNYSHEIPPPHVPFARNGELTREYPPRNLQFERNNGRTNEIRNMAPYHYETGGPFEPNNQYMPDESYGNPKAKAPDFYPGHSDGNVNMVDETGNTDTPETPKRNYLDDFLQNNSKQKNPYEIHYFDANVVDSPENPNGPPQFYPPDNFHRHNPRHMNNGDNSFNPPPYDEYPNYPPPNPAYRDPIAERMFPPEEYIHENPSRIRSNSSKKHSVEKSIEKILSASHNFGPSEPLPHRHSRENSRERSKLVFGSKGVTRVISDIPTSSRQSKEERYKKYDAYVDDSSSYDDLLNEALSRQGKIKGSADSLPENIKITLKKS